MTRRLLYVIKADPEWLAALRGSVVGPVDGNARRLTGDRDQPVGVGCGRPSRLCSPSPGAQTATVTFRKVAGIDVASLVSLLFCRSKRSSSSF
jgi:hypothetical protein